MTTRAFLERNERADAGGDRTCVHTDVSFEKGSRVLRIADLSIGTFFPGSSPAWTGASRDFVASQEVQRDLDLSVRCGARQEDLDLPLDFAVAFDSGGLWKLARNTKDPEDQVLEIAQVNGDERKGYIQTHFHLGKKRGEILVTNNSYGVGQYVHPLFYPLDELLFIQLLTRHQGILLHAFAAAFEKKGVCFAGVSGSGKSTLARLARTWRPELPILSDERVAVRSLPDEFALFGTPWHGEGGFWANERARLSAILFIGHALSGENRLREVRGAEAATNILVRSFPTLYSADGMERIMDLILELVSEVPMFELEFVPDVEVFSFLSREGVL